MNAFLVPTEIHRYSPQRFPLQPADCSESPSHGESGKALSHSLVRVLVPPSQVTLQSDHSPHACQCDRVIGQQTLIW